MEEVTTDVTPEVTTPAEEPVPIATAPTEAPAEVVLEQPEGILLPPEIFEQKIITSKQVILEHDNKRLIGFVLVTFVDGEQTIASPEALAAAGVTLP